MKHFLYILTICSLIFVTIHLSAEENGSNKHNTAGLILDGGFGAKYGGWYGVGLEYVFYNSTIHHFATHAGCSYDAQIESVLYGGGFRYSVGREDRLYIDLVYGVTDYTASEGYETKLYYDPSILVGYQRVMPNGIVVTLGAGCDVEFYPALELSLGYKFF